MTDIDGIEPGLAGSVAHTVTSDDTAIALGSGDVPVLATPRAVALVEEAACTALIGHLDPDHTTVGVHIELDHLLPTAPALRPPAGESLRWLAVPISQVHRVRVEI